MKIQIPIALPLLALVFSLALPAQTLVTSAELDKLAGQNQQSVIKRWLALDADVIEQNLSVYPQLQQAWLRKRLIEQLRQVDSPTPVQRQWVQQQSTSEHILYSYLPDIGHQQAVAVVNIPAQAKGLIARWQSIETAQQWLLAIKQSSFDWPSMIDQLSELKRATLALDYLLAGLPDNQQSALIESLLALKNSDTTPSNLLLSKLAMNSQAQHLQQQLYLWLWSKPADEHSIATLQSVVNNAISSDNIKQLKLASNNAKLTSLSLNLIARHYADEAAVIDYLFTLLSQNKKSAYAAAALAKSASPQIKQRLKQGLHSPDNQRRKASQLALQLSQQQQ
jgi:hypothetical protein